jgi:hypothetical protein
MASYDSKSNWGVSSSIDRQWEYSQRVYSDESAFAYSYQCSRLEQVLIGAAGARYEKDRDSAE